MVATTQPLQRDLSNFNGWMSSDKFLWPEGSFTFCSDLDPITHISQLVCASEYSLWDTADNDDGDITCFVSNGSDLRYFTAEWGTNSTWASYKNGTNVSGADADSWGTAWIYNAAKYGTDTILLVRPNRIDQLDTSTDTTSNILSYTADGTTRPVLLFGGNFLFGAGKFLNLIDATLASVDTKITFEDWEEIVFLSWYIDQVRIYTNKNGDMHQYIWDGISSEYQYENTIPWMRIVSGTQIYGIDYITMQGATITNDTRNATYQFTGSDYGTLFENTDFGNNYEYNDVSYNNENIVTYKDWFMLATQNDDWYNWPIRHRQSKVANTKALTGLMFNVQKTESINSMWIHQDYIYVAYNSSWGDQVYRQPLFQNNNTNKETGYLMTNYLWYESAHMQKKLRHIELAHYDITSNQTIQLEARTDENSVFQSIVTINTANALNTKIYANQIPDIWEFYWIQFRITMTPNGTTDPKLVRFIVSYDIVNE